MDPKQLFVDYRFAGVCAYCGGVADSRDHVPSKVLLDEPYPDNLPITESCSDCNQGFSLSEEYLACFLECVAQGTSEPNDNFRSRIAATLAAKPAIAQRIEASKSVSENGTLTWQPESNRVSEVVLKLARGHIAYELGHQRIDNPQIIEIVPLLSMSDRERASFLEIVPSGLYPEIGSRSFVGSLKGKVTAFETWCTVQSNNYQYAVGQGTGDWVKMVLRGYLACYVEWD